MSETLSQTGVTVWLTGLSGSGKTTIAREVAERLRDSGRRVEILDGDELRLNLSAGLGFSRADRDTHVARVGYVAQLLARNGVVVLVPVIAPYAEARAAVRDLHGDTPFLEVHVATPVEECERRDVKGLYAGARNGRVSTMTGISDPYEEPTAPDLRLDTTGQSVEQSAATVSELLQGRGLR